jgi:hypothetical protein
LAGGQKPGFFTKYFVLTSRLGKNPVSLVGGRPETGFLSKNPPSKPTDSVKNPVSLVGGWLFKGATAYHN